VRVRRQYLAVEVGPLDGLLDEHAVGGTHLTDALGDDQVRLQAGERLDVDLVDAAAALGLDDLAVYLRRRRLGVDARAVDRRQLGHAGRVVTLVGDPDRVDPERTDDLRRRRQQRDDTHC